MTMLLPRSNSSHNGHILVSNSHDASLSHSKSFSETPQNPPQNHLPPPSTLIKDSLSATDHLSSSKSSTISPVDQHVPVSNAPPVQTPSTGRRTSGRPRSSSSLSVRSITDSSHETPGRKQLLTSLKTVRSQHAHLARALRQAQAANALLKEEVEVLRDARQIAEAEVAELRSASAALTERNEITLALDPTWTGTESRSGPGTAPVSLITDRDIPLSDSSPVQPNLPPSSTNAGSALVDELEAARNKLVASEKRIATLTDTISTLQKQLVVCADERSSALEVERAIRYEVEAKAQSLALELAQSRRSDTSPALLDIPTSVSLEPVTPRSIRGRRMDEMTAAAFDRCDALERENLDLHATIRSLHRSEAISTDIIKHLQCSVGSLSEELGRYKLAAVNLKVHDFQRLRLQRTRTQKLARRKERIMESPAKIIVEHCDTSLDDDSDVGSPEVSFSNDSDDNDTSTPNDIIPVALAKRVSRAVMDYSVEGLAAFANTLIHRPVLNMMDGALYSNVALNLT